MHGFPAGSDGKETACNVGAPDSIPESGRSPWRTNWPPTLVFLPGESQGFTVQAKSIQAVLVVKNTPACQRRGCQETQVQSLHWEDPLEEGMATHSSILAWRIPWTEEPGGLQSMGLQRVGCNLASNASKAPTIPFLFFLRFCFCSCGPF